MAGTELTGRSPSSIAGLIRERQVSPVEVTAHFLERIVKYDGELRAFITTAPEQAMAEAHRAEAAVIAGDELGPLHGVPVGVKDLNSTRGIRTTYGSLLFGDNVPENDDIVTERIRASGAIIVGKTNTPDFGWKGTTESTIAGPCFNPWDTTRTSGGSSGGSGAALAARLVPLCNGGDAGGSIRIPASFCGVYGIKPGAGRVPGDYTSNTTWGGLSQNGPMSTNVRDSALLLDILAGPDARDPRSLGHADVDYLAAVDAPSVDGLRIAWAGAMDDQPTDPQVLALAQAGAEAFEQLGASVAEGMPAVTTDDAIWAFVTFMLTDLCITLGPAIESGRGDFLPAMLLRWLTDAKTWPASRYAEALHLREWHRHWFDELFERFDLLALPTMAVPAFPVERNPKTIGGREVHPSWGVTPFCLHANLTGRPAASIPCGFTEEGLPVGLMLVGRMGEEATILRASAAFEAAHPWAERRPPEFL
ncbi:MAG: amidase [Chloroflexi bacterium]|nr:amidase [Chloroflexota bacterium]